MSIVGNFLDDVGSTATGIVRGVGTAVTHLDDVARGAAWAANTRHWDDIGRGAGKAAGYVADHPGQVWDTGFEVGRYIVKDQLLDPKNLAINAGLLGLTMATGGSGGAALIGKLASGARTGRGAVTAARVMTAAEDAAEVARGASGAIKGIKAVEEVADVSKASRALSRVDDLLEMGPRAGSRVRQMITGKPQSWGMARRAQVAGRIEGQAPGALRTMVGDYVRQSSLKPTASGSAIGDFVSTNAWRARRVNTLLGKGGATETAGDIGQMAYDINKDPVRFATEAAMKQGYDVDEMGRKAYSKAAAKATQEVSQRALEGEDKPSTYQRQAQQQTTTAAEPSFQMATLDKPEATSFVKPYAKPSSTYTPSRSVYESSASGPVRAGRSSSFYSGMGQTGTYTPTNNTYGPRRSSYA